MTKPLVEVKAIRFFGIIAVIVVIVVSLFLFNEHHNQLTVTVPINTAPPNHGHLKFTADHHSKNWLSQKGARSKLHDSLKEETTMRRDWSLLKIKEQDDQPTVATVESKIHINKLRVASAESKTHNDQLTATFPSNHGLHFVTYHHSITLTSQKEATPKINDRVKEEMYVLRKNLQHPLVTSMHVIAANKTLLEKALRKEGVGDDKISIYDNSRPPTMKEVFQYVSDHLMNKIVVVSNGDIYLGSGFDRLNHTTMTEQRIMYALTRHHAPESNCTEGVALCSLPYHGSHDTFVFILHEPIPSDVLDELNYQLGSPGSENRLMWAFQTKLNYCLVNPCFVLKTYHFHCSGVRTSHERINIMGKSATCPPSKLLAIGFTSLDPGSPEPIPITIDDYRRRDDYWMLWGNIACFEGLKRDFSTANLVEGDSVGCCIGNNGSLEYFVNGERKGIICHNVPSNKPLYGVADMCGRIKKIQSEFHFNDITQNQEKDMEQRVATLEAKVASQSVKMDAIQRTLAAQIQELLLEQKQQIRQEMQQEFEARIQRVEGHMRERPPTWNIAKHQIEITDEILGRGAWGEVRIGVYQGTRVAIKKMHYVIISDYNRELFEREMENTSSVRHPNLVLFIGAVTTGNLTIVSELLEVSVRKLLEEGKLKLPDIRPIGKDVASALAYLHSLADPIIHRSVSSGNVLLHAKQDGWCAKLGDFASANFLAKLGTVGQGNATYSAPEVGNPSQQLQDPKMDVYSFGILLLEMCVGKLIAEHNLDMTKSAVKRWSSSDHNKKLLGDWAVRCTERDPNDRPDMVDFVKQLWPTVVHVTQVIV